MKLIRVYPPSPDQWRGLLRAAGIFLAANIAARLLIHLIFYVKGI